MLERPAGTDYSPDTRRVSLRAVRPLRVGGRPKLRRSRLERAEKLEKAAVRLAAGEPQRQVAEDLGLARSTLQ